MLLRRSSTMPTAPCFSRSWSAVRSSSAVLCAKLISSMSPTLPGSMSELTDGTRICWRTIDTSFGSCSPGRAIWSTTVVFGSPLSFEMISSEVWPAVSQPSTSRTLSPDFRPAAYAGPE